MIMRVGWSAGLLLAATCLAGCEPASDEDSREAEQARPTAATQTSAGPSPDAISCDSPVSADDDAETLVRRFGEDARFETLYGPEGIEIPAVVLWPREPARRVNVHFADDERREIVSVNLGDESAWRIAGLSVGDPLSRAIEANGRGFALWGFSWDYGGYVSDLRGGRLAALPGGCRVLMRLARADGGEVPVALMGDGELSSDDPLLETAGVRIDELGITFPPEE